MVDLLDRKRAAQFVFGVVLVGTPVFAVAANSEDKSATEKVATYVENLTDKAIESTGIRQDLSKHYEKLERFSSDKTQINLIGTAVAQQSNNADFEKNRVLQSNNRQQPSAYRSNPFGVTRQLQRKTISNDNGESNFVRSEAHSELPEIKLRGIINQQVDKESGGEVYLGNMALLEVDKKVYMVRPGETVSVFVQKRNTVFRVIEVGRHSVSIEIGSLGGDGQVLLVR